MSLFDKLGQPQTRQQRPQTPTLQELQAHPEETLKRAGLNIPAGMDNPQQIIDYLLQSGQINNPRLQMAQKLCARLFGR